MSTLTANNCSRCGGELRFDQAGEIVGCSSGCALFLIRASGNGHGPGTGTAEVLAEADAAGLEGLPPSDNRATMQPPPLAGESAILDSLSRDLVKCGLVGEDRAAKLVFLAAVSRLHDRPVSVVLKGPSSGGKSFIVETVLSFFPESAYHALTGGSERALAYSQEPLKHRMLVVYEAAGITGDLPSYFLRSLLSEGRLRYETVESTAEGIRSKLIEREGPTGLIITTTAVKLRPENETRLLSIPVNDTPEQTRQVPRALAHEDEQQGPDLLPWLVLQDWLAARECEVSTPFAARLADLIPPVAVRLRRDFSTVLGLVRAHARCFTAPAARRMTPAGSSPPSTTTRSSASCFSSWSRTASGQRCARRLERPSRRSKRSRPRMRTVCHNALSFNGSKLTRARSAAASELRSRPATSSTSKSAGVVPTGLIWASRCQTS
jgi:hypothetical protein